MSSSKVENGVPVFLSGEPFERGYQQAKCCESLTNSVKEAVKIRLQSCSEIFKQENVKRLIGEIKSFHLSRDPEIMEEINGISSGFGIEPDELFNYLNVSIASDYVLSIEGGEECTSFSVSRGSFGSLVAKNRDYRSEHIKIQKVFLHSDPSWEGRQMLCVGSLGSPGNFSSGMNSDGLAIADTASRVRRYGIGCHRYFLLTRVLVRCSTVSEALSEISSTPHAGGGTLTIADSTGTIAVVELGHEAQSFDIRREGWLARTNHFVSEQLSKNTLTIPQLSKQVENSKARLATLHKRLGQNKGEWNFKVLAKILSYRGQFGGTALCRDGKDSLVPDHPTSQTISGTIYDTSEKQIWFAAGLPGTVPWVNYSFS